MNRYVCLPQEFLDSCLQLLDDESLLPQVTMRSKIRGLLTAISQVVNFFFPSLSRLRLELCLAILLMMILGTF